MTAHKKNKNVEFGDQGTRDEDNRFQVDFLRSFVTKKDGFYVIRQDFARGVLDKLKVLITRKRFLQSSDMTLKIFLAMDTQLDIELV